MKYILALILTFLCLTVFSQTELQFRGKLNIYFSSGTSPNFTISALFMDDMGYYTSDSISVNDIIYAEYNNGCVELRIDSIISQSGGVLQANIIDIDTLLSSPIGQTSIFTTTPNKNFPIFPQGMSEQLQACIITDLSMKIDNEINNIENLINALPSGSGTTNQWAYWLDANTLTTSNYIVRDATRLTLNAPVRLQNLATVSLPGVPSSGDLLYNTTAGNLGFYGSSAWEYPVKSSTSTGLFTAESVLFANANGRVSESNTNFNYNNTLKTLNLAPTGHNVGFPRIGLKITNLATNVSAAGSGTWAKYGILIEDSGQWDANAGTQYIGLYVKKYVGSVYANYKASAKFEDPMILGDMPVSDVLSGALMGIKGYAGSSSAINENTILIINRNSTSGTLTGLTIGQNNYSNLTSAIHFVQTGVDRGADIVFKTSADGLLQERWRITSARGQLQSGTTTSSNNTVFAGELLNIRAKTVVNATGETSNYASVIPSTAFFGTTTINSTPTITIPAAATVHIQSAPVAGTNTTITNNYALWVDAGAARFDGTLEVSTRTGTATSVAGWTSDNKATNVGEGYGINLIGGNVEVDTSEILWLKPRLEAASVSINNLNNELSLAGENLSGANNLYPFLLGFKGASTSNYLYSRPELKMHGHLGYLELNRYPGERGLRMIKRFGGDGYITFNANYDSTTTIVRDQAAPIVAIGLESLNGGQIYFSGTSQTTGSFEPGDDSKKLLTINFLQQAVGIGSSIADLPEASLHVVGRSTNEPTRPVLLLRDSSDNEDLFSVTQNGEAYIQDFIHLGGAFFTQIAIDTVNNTASETSLISTGEGTTTLPADYLEEGRDIKCEAWGTVTTNGSPPSLELNLKLGSTVVWDSGSFSMIDLSAGIETWYANISFTTYTEGVSGTVMPAGEFSFFVGGDPSFGKVIRPVYASPVTINTTTSQTIDFTATWGSADVNASIVMTKFVCRAEN